jgi:hypothetical protein
MKAVARDAVATPKLIDICCIVLAMVLALWHPLHGSLALGALVGNGWEHCSRWRRDGRR